MADRIPHFSGGVDSVRDKLNRLVDEANAISQIWGDEVFIRVAKTVIGGVTIGLNIDRVLERVARIIPDVSVKYAKANAAWTSGNTIVCTACTSQTDGTATGEGNVTLYLVSPYNASPTGFSIAQNDILAYLPIPGTTTGIAMPVARVKGTTTYQVRQMLTDSTEGFGWVKAHA